MSLNKKFVTAYKWNMLGKLSVRCMGIVSTLILVRLLGPEDFGLIALAMMVTGLFEVISNSGVNRYLILHDSPTISDYHSAWTLDIILRTISIVLLWFVAPYIATYLNNDELITVIRAISLINLIGFFKNIGLIKLERELNYKVQNKILIHAKVISFITTIGAAFIFQNYYALIIGTLINTMMTTLLSYIYVPFKSSFNFNFEKNMYIFSSKLIVRNIFGYTRSQLDTFLVGKLFGNVATGQYNIARQFSIMPQSEILSPAMQPAFSALASLKNNEEQLKDKVYQALFLSVMFVVPCAFGLTALASPFVTTVLGDKWLEIIPFIGTLSFLMIPFITQPLFYVLYDSKKMVSRSMLTDLFGIVSMLCIVTFTSIDSLTDFANCRVYIGLASVLLSMILAKLFLQLSLKRLALIYMYPLTCGYIMYKTIPHLQAALNINITWLELLLLTGLGLLIFTILIITTLLCIKNYKNSFFYRLFPTQILDKLKIP